ncbi:23S rRNA (guanosine2251-2'-O)-methyltransferase [Spiroplasma sp. TIUS-1]|uniref:23S rRNA (guanosine(2251)-2'-O)-methyltransferase RlmB n=1 Tax=Spiroplasma sp. TIUS-1 TaxID=216963 RepID=UPI001398281E|nr:23S rRNA (guanosine(2251)-2'-O)-methyltransferase RlmB [Spiroplasma sp. TIUS-1]QHX35583.1 23S rRNA (guanosine2251-2'-O)-methyltransferase [Spiroplasma sp. TIUS-1]
MKDFLYGRKPVFNILMNNPKIVKSLFIQESIVLTKQEEEILSSLKIYVSKLPRRKMDDITLENHQGVICEVKEFQYTHFGDISKNPDKYKTILCLDKIQDPHNFGAIIRSAALFGVDLILMLDHSQVAVNATVFKTSAGTLFKTKIARVSNLSNAIEQLKKGGYWVYCSALTDDSVEIDEIKFDTKSVIIIGNEGEGVGQKIQNISDYKFKIKTKNIIDSLNVSVATGIILHSLNKGRG